jgi:serine/threonine protein phosphatase PrpC
MNGSFPVLDASGKTDTGLKRDQNEDYYDMLLPKDGVSEGLFIVADGIGGMSGGDIASKSTVREIIRRYTTYRAQDVPASAQDIMLFTLEETNVHIRNQASKIGLARMGSTVAGIVLLADLQTVVFNVGDSRVYRIRNGRIERLTRDQTLSEQQIEQGIITREEAQHIRNSPITAYLGQPMPIQPYCNEISSLQGDIYIICSDGLWNLVKDPEILQIVARSSSEAAVDKLIKLVLKRGAPDNVTVIITRIGTAPRPTTSILSKLMDIFG